MPKEPTRAQLHQQVETLRQLKSFQDIEIQTLKKEIDKLKKNQDYRERDAVIKLLEVTANLNESASKALLVIHRAI